MLKFFKNIRKELVSERAFKRYLKYALGEIVLVVIAVLVQLGFGHTRFFHQIQDELVLFCGYPTVSVIPLSVAGSVSTVSTSARNWLSCRSFCSVRAPSGLAVHDTAKTAASAVISLDSAP